MSVFRNSFLVASLILGAAASGASIAHDAHASVSLAVTWDGLLREATSAAIVTPAEQRSVWENGRIYTYTRVRVDRAIAGELQSDGEAWVRTMGGVVGKIGQLVDGEAVLTVGRPSLLFLHPGPTGSFEVTARAQGQFPVVADTAKKGALRVIKSGALGMLIKPKPAAAKVPLVNPQTLMAQEKLHDRPVDDVAKDIASDWPRTHAK